MNKHFAYAYIKHENGYKLISGYFDNGRSWMFNMSHNPNFYLGGSVDSYGEIAVVFPDNYNGDDLPNFDEMSQKCLECLPIDK